MARTVRNGKIDTRSARARLTIRREPYWTVIGAGCALGYRKGQKGGSWVARWRDPNGQQHYQAIGAADDAADTLPGALSYAQAQAQGRAWFERAAREFAGEPTQGGSYTVAQAMADYLESYAKRGKGLAATRASVNALILPALGDIQLSRLSKRQIEDWLHALVTAPARLRTRTGCAQRYRDIGDDPEAPRRRRATANRVLTILKAALNHSLRARKVASDEAWRHVQRFREVDAARPRYLSDDEAKRLVNACDPEFRQMLQAALLTGMRYGELAALRVSDFNPDAGTIEVRQSKAGKSRHVVLTDEGRAFFAIAGAGKPGSAILLSRPNGKPWGKSHQLRPMAEACARAAISPAISFHGLRHTYASRLVMKGVPLFVVAAQLGHRDTRMVEHHYGHLAPSYIAETVRTAFGTLGIFEAGKIVSLRK